MRGFDRRLAIARLSPGRCRQRLGRRLRQREDVDQALAVLNWCAGYPTGGGGDGGLAERLVQQWVEERGPPLSSETEEEAACALLRDKAGYEAGCSNVASFELSRVALPDDISGAPYLEEALPRSARKYLKDSFAPMLKSEAGMLELADHGVPVTPYMDAVLRRDRASYVQLVALLLERGILQTTVRPAEQASLSLCTRRTGPKG